MAINNEIIWKRKSQIEGMVRLSKGYKYFVSFKVYTEFKLEDGVFTGIQETAKKIKQKYVYIFHVGPNGRSLNREIKIDENGLFIRYQLPDFDDLTQRYQKTDDNMRSQYGKKVEKIYFDDQKFGSNHKWYFCLSQIRLSIDRINVYFERICDNNCNRFKIFPLSKWPPADPLTQGLENIEFKDDHYHMVVYLTDYLDYAYHEISSTKEEIFISKNCLISKLLIAKKNYEKWLEGTENKHIIWKNEEFESETVVPFKRNELKTINDGIWFLAKNGSKKIGSHNFWDILISYLYRTSEYSATNNWSVENERVRIADELYSQAIKESPYIEKLEPFNKKNPEDFKKFVELEKIKKVNRQTKNYIFTNAEAWRKMYEYDEAMLKQEIEKHAILIVEWVKQPDFVAMQHDYLYSELDNDLDKLYHILGYIYKVLRCTECGKEYLNFYAKEIVKLLESLKLGITNAETEDVVNKIYKKEIEQIKQPDRLELLEKSKKCKNEINFLATAFFVLRKLSIGTVSVVEGLESSLINMKIKISTLYDKSKLGFRMAEIEKKLSLQEQISNNKIINSFVNSEALEKFMLSLELVNVGFMLSDLYDDEKQDHSWSKKLKFISAIADLSTEISKIVEKKLLLRSKEVLKAEKIKNVAIAKAKNKMILKNAFKISNKLLSGISSSADAIASLLLAQECALSGERASQKYNIISGIGAVLSLASVFLPEGVLPGIIVFIGGLLQISGDILAELFRFDDYEKWITHCFWGKDAFENHSGIPWFATEKYMNWKTNLNIQIKALFNILFSFRVKIYSFFYEKYKPQTLFSDDKEIKIYQISIFLFPKLYFPGKSHFIFTYLYLENQGEERIISKSNIFNGIRHNKNNDSEIVDAIEIILTDEKSTHSAKFKKPSFSIKNPLYSKKFSSCTIRIKDLKDFIKTGTIVLKVSLDLLGNNSFNLPFDGPKYLSGKLFKPALPDYTVSDLSITTTIKSSCIISDEN